MRRRAAHTHCQDFDLAAFLLSNIGRLVSRHQIVNAVWGKVETLTSRTLDTHVSRVRKRLGLTAENGWKLRAVCGVGYRLERTKVPAVLGRPINRSLSKAPARCT